MTYCSVQAEAGHDGVAQVQSGPHCTAERALPIAYGTAVLHGRCAGGVEGIPGLAWLRLRQHAHGAERVWDLRTRSSRPAWSVLCCQYSSAITAVELRGRRIFSELSISGQHWRGSGHFGFLSTVCVHFRAQHVGSGHALCRYSRLRPVSRVKQDLWRGAHESTKLC